MSLKSALLAILFVLILALNPAAAAELKNYKPLEHAQAGLSDIPNTESLIIFGTGSAATIASYIWLDKPVRKFFESKRRLGDFEKAGNIAGNGLPSTLLSLGLLGYGLATDHEREKHAGISGLETALFDFIFTHALKYTVRRERPDASSRTSFPSGHASRSFGQAGTLLSFYGWKVGVPALLLAGWIATARMSSNKHYLSDTIFGGTIGLITSRAFAKHHLVELRANIRPNPVDPAVDLSVSFRIDFQH